MSGRTRYYKGANIDLRGHFYGRGQAGAYLPGSVHEEPLLVESTAVSCGKGLYYCSHRRVAARWGKVVLSVEILGRQVKSDARVKPGYQMPDVPHGQYNKYRTDRMLIVDVIGVVGWAGEQYDPSSPIRRLGEQHDRVARSEQDAQQALVRLNATLKLENSEVRYALTGRTLEVLRDEGYRIWEVVRREAPKRNRYRVEIAIESLRSEDAVRGLVEDAVSDELHNYGEGDKLILVEVTKQEA